ncbi:hypothetical protein HL42_5646 [Trichophyton rubrum]|nr:hypothetical protein HL42_5646 [Trichophyton rubrum]
MSPTRCVSVSSVGSYQGGSRANRQQDERTQCEALCYSSSLWFLSPQMGVPVELERVGKYLDEWDPAKPVPGSLAREC